MKSIFKIFFFSALIISCDAPRENPFDPASPNYKTEDNNKASTQLFVHSLNPPYLGIPNVQVGEKFTPFFGITDANGKVEWEHDKKDSLFFILNADGYFSDSILFTGNGMSNNLETALNAKPELLDIKFNSIHQNLDGTFQATYISISTKVMDNDGVEDIQSLVLREINKSFSDTLVLTDPLIQKFETDANITTIDQNLEPSQLPELNFILVVKNQNGDSVVSNPLYIKRVIEENIVLTAPDNNSTHQDSVLFEWESVYLNFPFTYNIMMQRLQDSAKFLYSDIPSTQNNYVVKNLSSGTYFWQIQVVDVLGNICQSIFMSFKYVR